MKRGITNLAASVNQRLLNLRDSRKEDFQLILNRYGLERFLHRLSQGPFSDRLILKGAFSFELWGPEFYRPTRDVDFLGLFEPSPEEIRRAFMHICLQDVEPDGLVFDPGSVSVEAIRERDGFGGFRVNLTASLGRSRIRMQFDIVIARRMTPEPVKALFPVLLPFPAPRVSVYPKELTIADKYHAMCKLGILNSRVKDHYDIFHLANHFPFEGRGLKNGIRMIFEDERFPIPAEPPAALTDVFGRLPEKELLWRQFLTRIGKGSLDLDLSDVIESLRRFVFLPGKAAAEGAEFDLVWPPGGPWRPQEKDHAG